MGHRCIDAMLRALAILYAMQANAVGTAHSGGAFFFLPQ
jgi:hypothetical protein